MSDKRKPILEKVACYYANGKGDSGFEFFKKLKVLDNDIFVYKEGILWKLKQAEKEAKNSA